MRIEGLGLALAGTTAAGVLLAMLGWLLTGSHGAMGAGFGTLLVVGFFGFGAVTVNLVAAVTPRASMVVALLTYVLQVLMLALALVGLSRSDLAPGTVDPRWVAGAVLVGTLVWTGALLVGTVRAGVPPVEEAVSDRSRGTSHPQGVRR